MEEKIKVMGKVTVRITNQQESSSESPSQEGDGDLKAACGEIGYRAKKDE